MRTKFLKLENHQKLTHPAKSTNITETSTLFITKGYSGLLKFSDHTIDVTIKLTYMTSWKMLLLLTASVLSFQHVFLLKHDKDLLIIIKILLLYKRRSSQLQTQLLQLRWKESLQKKKFRLERDSNPWPLRYRCSALPIKLTSQLGVGRWIGSY